MKTLIAIKSCHDDLDKGCHDTILETWGREVSDLRFFVGCSRPTNLPVVAAYTIDLDVADDYDHLPQKTQAILKWFCQVPSYDYIFLCDVDTFLIPSKLFKANVQDYQDYDYSGLIGMQLGKTFNYKDGRGVRHPKCYTWASGGFGYFLSKKAAQVVVNTSSVDWWAEDMFVGDALGPKIASGEITAANLENFQNVSSWHYPAHRLGWTRERMKLWMHEMYKEHFNDR